MPITGKFEADFSQFSGATAAAETDLKHFQSTATEAVGAVTDLEKATATAAPRASTLAESYSKFDGALNAAGIHIGPQIKAIEDIGTAAGKTAGELGLLASAGLVVGTAMAAWKVGTWIGETTGLTQAIQTGTASLLGYGDVANQTAQAVDESIVLAFKRTGVWARDGAEALRLNTQWAKDNQKQAKESAKAYKEWSDAMAEINSGGKSWQATLETIDGETVNAVQYYLKAGRSQSDLAKAYALTDTQMRAVVASLAAEKKAIDDAAAARTLYDKELKLSYDAQIQQLDGLEKARLNHYGIDAQIEILKQLQQKENDVTAAVYGQIGSEKERMTVLEANNKRQTQLEIEIGKLREDQTKTMAESTLRSIGLQTQLNKAYGLDAQGAILLPQDAMTEYQKKITSINNTMVDGAEKTLALKVANQELADSFLKDAQAADAATAALGANGAALGGSLVTAQSLITAKSLQTTASAYPSAVGRFGQEFQLKSAFRAAGGPVEAGASYIVGERGPELFVPAVSGAIAPSIGGARSIQIVVNVQGSILSSVAELERAMVSAYRQGGNRLPA